MAVFKTSYNDLNESAEAGLTWLPGYSHGWIPVKNVSRLISEEIDLLSLNHVVKNGQQYCDFNRLIKIVEEYLTLKTVSDECNHF